MDAELPLGFGTLLRRHRIAAGLTQEELAERAYISRRSISDMERGVPHRPHKETVELLAEALGLAGPDRGVLTKAAGRHRASLLPPVASTGPPRDRWTTPLFVGRAPELALLERHLAGEGPPILLFAGEPGIGKSRLLHAAVPQARDQEWCVLEAGCQRRGGHEPYAPLLGAVQHYIREQSPDRLRLDLQGCAWLIRLLPELADGPIPPLPSWTLTPDQEYRLMVEAVSRFLTNIAGPAGTLLVLDDLQWTDPDAFDLLASLVRSAAALPLRIIGAYRDTEVGPQDALCALLADLAPARLASRRSLGPLTSEESAQLLDDLLEGTDAGESGARVQVLQRAGGVPFFLVSCAQSLGSGEAEGAVPWDVAQSVRQRVATLPTAARDVLGTAAVVGRVVPRTVLVGVTVGCEKEVLEALDAICQAQLLQETTEDAYRFGHDVVREVVEADLGTARRRVVHQRVAEVLEQRPGEPAVELLAYHYARSDAAEKAALYLEQAGDRAQSQHAHTSAASHYCELIDLLDELGRERDAARACEKLGVALYLTGRYDAALPMLERAVEAYHLLGDLEGQRRTLAQIGWVHAVRGTSEEGIARIESVFETLDRDTPSPGLAALYVALGRMYGVRGRYRECLNAAERAVETARATEDSRGLAAAEAQLSDVLVMLLRFDEALQAADEAARLAEKAVDLRALCTAYSSMVGVYARKGDIAKARTASDRSVEVAELLGDPEVITLARSNRCMSATWTGEWALARADIETAVSLGREIGPFNATGFALLKHGVLCLYEGDWVSASQHLEECVAIAERSNSPQILPSAQSWLAELDLRMGHPDDARRRLIPFLDRPDPTQPETVWVIGVRPLLAWAYLELGELARAKDMVAYCLARARGSGDRLLQLGTLQAQAMVAAREERWANAAQALEEGLLLAQGMPYPYQEARLLQMYGRMHASKGEPERARERLKQALAIFGRLGAKKDTERTDQELTSLIDDERS
jgi:tetratricopeptide (TPR) repeat protein/transcriptional regulator with XRE-family HTH domain